MKWGRGILLTNSRANILDSFFPLLTGLVEFSLFALLSLRLFLPTLTDIQRLVHQTWPNWWFLALAAHGLLSVGLVVNRLCVMNISADFDTPLHPVASTLRGWMRGDVLGASAFSCGALLVWLALHRGWIAEGGALIGAAVLGVVLFAVAWQADQERRVIEAAVQNVP